MPFNVKLRFFSTEFFYGKMLLLAIRTIFLTTPVQYNSSH